MDIRTERYGPIVVLRMAGRLDAFGAKALDQALDEILAAPDRDDGPDMAGLVLDIPGVNYLSSAGVRSLLAALKALKARGGVLALAGTGDYCRKVLEMSGLLPAFPMLPDSAEAMDFCLARVRDARVLARWDSLETAETEAGSFRFVPGSNDPGAARVLGHVSNVLESSITRGRMFEKRFSDTEYSIGLGSLGGELEESFGLLGEMMTIGGTMVWLPTDGNDTADFLIPKVDTGAVTIKTGFNVALNGKFNECAMFEAASPQGATVSELYRAVFELARERRSDFKGVVGMAAWAEMGEVYGSGIKRSPVTDNAPADGNPIISPEHVGDWFDADTEPRHRDVTALTVGLGADLTGELDLKRDELESVFYLHPAATADKAEMLHNHAVIFSPLPMPEKMADLDRAVRQVVDEAEFIDMRHLLDTSRIHRAFLGLTYIQRFVPDEG